MLSVSFLFIYLFRRGFYLQKKKNILDIGSYQGNLSFYIYSHNNQVTGIELSDKCDFAKIRYKFYKINFIKGDVLNVTRELKDESIDFILCHNFPGHYDSGQLSNSKFMMDLINELKGKIKIGGTIYWCFTKNINVSIHPVSYEDLSTFINKKGLKKCVIGKEQKWLYYKAKNKIVKDEWLTFIWTKQG